MAIASYGSAQDHYARRLVAEYARLSMPVRVVVLSNEEKQWPGVEVITGLPSPDPYSLPFAHRAIFAKNVDQYDLFIYSEDDTLITENHVRAFISADAILGDDEVAGFVRSESDSDGRPFITSVNTLFRWPPESIVERHGELFAAFSNQHSGCYMVTQKHLKRALASGGFLVPPHAEIYGMLESAASDIYTQCGLRRLLSLTKIHDFVVKHLPNKYYRRMGVPVEELELQIRALIELHQNGGWAGKLFEPCSGAPGFRWSKNLYERPDEELLNVIPRSAKTVLSVGCGWGATEAWLAARGFEVCAVPLDAVFGECLKNRGIRTVVGPFSDVISSLSGERFDVVLLSDVLHLIERPVEWLRNLSGLLERQGQVIATIPNTSELPARVKDISAGREPLARRKGFQGVQPIKVSRLKKWCRSAGLEPINIVPQLNGSKSLVRKWGAKVMRSAFASRFILTAVRRASN